MFFAIGVWARPCPEDAYFHGAKGNPAWFIRVWGPGNSGNANYCAARKWSNSKSLFKGHFSSVPGNVSFQASISLSLLHFVLETACLRAEWRWTHVPLFVALPRGFVPHSTDFFWRAAGCRSGSKAAFRLTCSSNYKWIFDRASWNDHPPEWIARFQQPRALSYHLQQFQEKKV